MQIQKLRQWFSVFRMRINLLQQMAYLDLRLFFLLAVIWGSVFTCVHLSPFAAPTSQGWGIVFAFFTVTGLLNVVLTGLTLLLLGQGDWVRRCGRIECMASTNLFLELGGLVLYGLWMARFGIGSLESYMVAVLFFYDSLTTIWLLKFARWLEWITLQV